MIRENVEILVDVVIGGVFAVFFFLFIILLQKCRDGELARSSSFFDTSSQKLTESFHMDKAVQNVRSVMQDAILDPIFAAKSSSNMSTLTVNKTTSTLKNNSSNKLSQIFVKRNFNELSAQPSPVFSDGFDQEYFAATEVPMVASKEEHDLVKTIPHCLGILSTSNSLTKFLMGYLKFSIDDEDHIMHPLYATIKTIMKYDNEIRLCLYPPLDLELAEEKISRLVKGITGLVDMVRYQYKDEHKVLLWMNKCLAEIESHILSIQKLKLTISAKSTLKQVMGSQYAMEVSDSGKDPFPKQLQTWESYVCLDNLFSYASFRSMFGRSSSEMQ